MARQPVAPGGVDAAALLRDTFERSLQELMKVRHGHRDRLRDTRLRAPVPPCIREQDWPPETRRHKRTL
jgi:hypothetical protein